MNDTPSPGITRNSSNSFTGMQFPRFEFSQFNSINLSTARNAPRAFSDSSLAGSRDLEGGDASITPTTPINVDNTINFNMSQQLSPELLSGRFKFMIFFLLLLGLRILFDYLIPTIVLISGAMVLTRIRKEHNIQISAKKKSNGKILFVLFFFACIQIIILVKFVQLYGSPEKIENRLIFLYSYLVDSKSGETAKEYHLQSVCWGVIVVDGIVQIAIVALKVLLCGLYDANLASSFSQLCHIISGFICKYLKSFSFVIFLLSLGLQFFLLFAPPAASGSSQQQQRSLHAAPLHLGGGSLAASHIPEATPMDDNISNSSSSEREAAKYILKLRLCALVDIFGLFYRSALPIPAWVAYFSVASFGSSAFNSLYIVSKLYDLWTKGSGAVEAVAFFVHQRPEFGHYSTDEEINSPTFCCDCPICFDSPLNKPITLGCNHAFCEVALQVITIIDCCNYYFYK